jgi:hypothetical protein
LVLKPLLSNVGGGVIKKKKTFSTL